MSAWAEPTAAPEIRIGIDALMYEGLQVDVDSPLDPVALARDCQRALARTRSWKHRIEDDALVAKFQDGMSTAFNELTTKYQARLLRLVSRLIHDRADAEDVVQEALIRAYRALPAFRGDSAFYTWLFTIVVNTAKNFRSSQSKRACLSVKVASGSYEGSDEAPVIIDFHTPLAELEKKQIILALNRVLDAMPEAYSLPFILYQIEGMSYEDIAQTMACPMGTVRSRIARARSLIAAKLAPFVSTVPASLREPN